MGGASRSPPPPSPCPDWLGQRRGGPLSIKAAEGGTSEVCRPLCCLELSSKRGAACQDVQRTCSSAPVMPGEVRARPWLAGGDGASPGEGAAGLGQEQVGQAAAAPTAARPGRRAGGQRAVGGRPPTRLPGLAGSALVGRLPGLRKRTLSVTHCGLCKLSEWHWGQRQDTAGLLGPVPAPRAAALGPGRRGGVSGARRPGPVRRGRTEPPRPGGCRPASRWDLVSAL